MWHRRPSGWRAAGLLLCAAVLALFVAAPASADWPGWGRLTVVSVAVTPSDPTLQTGQTMQLKATATFGDGTTRDVTKKAAWTSSAPAVTVSGAGLATAISAGTATVRATVAGVSGATVVSVGAHGYVPGTITHVVWIMMENHSASTIIGSSAAPYINSLASRYGLAANYSAISHPSLPNYLAAVSGQPLSSLPITDCTSCKQSGPSLFTQGETWKAYQESMTTPCEPFKSADGLYVPRHNPPLYFTRIPATTCSANDVAYSALAGDLANGTLPAFSFVTPNLAHDMHDGTIAQGDAWLAAQLPAILSSPAYRSGTTAVFLTWDEGSGTGNVQGVDCLADTTNPSCKVATVVISPYTTPGTVATAAYDHYSLLRTTERLLGLPLLGLAATAPDMGPAFGLG